MSIKPLIPPTININGTSPEELLKQHRSVLAAIDMVQRAMAEASPHGRDYQTRHAEVYMAARDAWVQRMQVVVRLRAEIEANGEAIVEQIIDREE